MQKYTQIKEKIKEAMIASCNDMLEFTDEPAMEFNAEYLFTVNTAKSINKLNGPPGDPYKIYIEKSTRQLSRDCIPPVRFGNAKRRESSIFRRKAPEIKRSGRVDVAVYHTPPKAIFGHQPLCVIELKGFNPQRKVVLDDLKRNLEFLRISGETGGSVLSFAIFAALHSFNGSSEEWGLKKDIEETKKKYIKWLAEVGGDDDIFVETEFFTVSKEILGRIYDEGEYATIDTDARHHFVGALICFVIKANALIRNDV